MATKAKRRADPSMGMPWTPAEDAKLREITEIGLSSEFWPTALPHRTHGSICERRLTLGIKPAALV